MPKFAATCGGDKRRLPFAANGRPSQRVLDTVMVKKLLHTRYRVTDLEKTIGFYQDVLGLEMTHRSKSPRGSELVFFKAPGSEEEIEICKFDESGPVVVGPDLTHLAFEVEDMDAFSRHAAALGYPLSDGPTRTSSGSVIAFVDAPEGYEIELIQKD
jgi:lactoylglutathione lyase